MTTRPVLVRSLRTAALGVVLALTMLLVPNSSVNPTDSALVRVPRAEGVDLSPDVIWILALGSDARPGQSVTRSRADAIQLVGINTRTGAATSIGVPRDSWVGIPGHGNEKITAAMYFGGPKLMAKAVGDLVGIEPDYVMVSSFWGLRHMVDAIGPITISSPVAFSDPHLRPQGFRKGRQQVGGMGALAFSRTRKALLRGDFDRSANQQRTIRAIHAKIRAKQAKPGFIEKGVLAVLTNMDAQVPPAELYRIAQAITQVRPGRITTCVVLGGIGNVGGASVVFPNRSQARRYGHDARKDATIRSC
ncbi:LCP family protein [Nocardioides guangzhouensis]|uniref:LCP family protein n=1 Tax=Nocardioides guangzhouensis TaxID=2497878 RepID=UPI001FEA6D03|nr:LCP family protein [Nocardioides guangzhouensis]